MPQSTSGSTLSSEPPLPANVASRHRFVVGVKCDFPPFGYLTSTGEHAGFEIDVVRDFAKLAFGSKEAVTLTCVTATNRFAFLKSGRIDFLMATVAYLASRAKVVDFSNPYFESGGVLLVPKRLPHNEPQRHQEPAGRRVPRRFERSVVEEVYAGGHVQTCLCGRHKSAAGSP